MKNLFPSLRGVFGSWVYYPALLTPKQINDLVEASYNIRESETLDDHLQREITPNVNKILTYLKQSNDRFFNSIIIGVFDDVPDWYSLDLSQVEILNKEERENIEESMGILKFSGSERLFAVDGQHRVEAIKSYYSSDESYNDQISVIFIAHSDTREGKKRTRRLFSDLNKTAQKVSPGELAIIDEQDIENIVARKVYAEYGRLSNQFISLSKTAPIKANEDLYFTNLLTLVKVAKIISKLHIIKTKITYDEEDINIVFSLVTEFFDILFDSIPSLEDSLGNRALTKKLRLEGKMVYMRPVGLEILAGLYVLSKVNESVKTFNKGLRSIDLSLKSVYFEDIIFSKNKVSTRNKLFSQNLLAVKLGLKSLDDISIPEGYEKEHYANI